MANNNEERNGQGNAPEQGFNTIRNSSIDKREKKTVRRNYTFLAIVVLVALLIVTLLVTAIGGIVANVAGDKEPGKTPAENTSDKDVEWVNATFSDSDTQHGSLVLVNATHQYVFPSVDAADDENLEEIYAAFAQHSPRIYKLSGLSKYMNKTALYALDDMLVAFNSASGKNNILISYAYRSAADQQALLDKGYSTSAVGYSDHHTGYGIVLKYDVDGRNYDLSADAAYAWIGENCHKYGFVVRYPEAKADKTGVSDYEEYFRYVGVPHAVYMNEKDLCLEEYVEQLKNYTQDKPLKITDTDGAKYLVYHAAVSGNTTVKVPSNVTYTVSGTNEGGVIITVNLSEAVVAESDSDSDSESESVTESTPVESGAAS